MSFTTSPKLTMISARQKPRYDASKEEQELVGAINAPVEVVHLDIVRSFGTCMLKMA